MASDYNRKTYDHAMLLKAAGLLAASTPGSIILNIGPGLMRGDVVIDVSAIEVAGGDEIYTISLEGSNVAAMTSGSVELASKILGNNPAPADADAATPGRYTMPFTNDFEGTLYSYVRLHTTIAGAIATGINYLAFIALPK